MALSLLQYPDKLLPVRQPVTFIVQSTSTGTPLRIAGAVTQADGDSIQADSQKKAQFEFSDYLQSLVEERGKLSNTPVVYTTVPKVVTFSFIEWSGSPVINTFDLADQGPYYVLDAGIPKPRRAALYNYYSSLLDYLVQTKSCLTWWPDGEAKRVLYNQMEFLNYLQVSSAQAIDITVVVSLQFTDGTTGTAGTVFTIPAVDYMQCVYVPTGCTQLGLPILVASNYPGQTLQGYTVTLKSGSTAISKVYSYFVDSKWYENQRELWVKNPFGLLEVLLCTGIGQQDDAIKLTASVETDGQSLPDKLPWSIEKTDITKVNTGFMTAAQIRWLSDLLETTEAYELKDTMLQPLVLKDVSIPTVHDGEYQFAAEIEYEYAYFEIIEQG